MAWFCLLELYLFSGRIEPPGDLEPWGTRKALHPTRPSQLPFVILEALGQAHIPTKNHSKIPENI